MADLEFKPPAKEQVLTAIGEIVSTRANVDLMLGRSIAGDILAELQRPSREHGQRVLAVQEANDLISAEIMSALQGQLLIVFVNRLGGNVTVPVAEVDGTGGWLLSMTPDLKAATLTFATRKKQ